MKSRLVRLDARRVFSYTLHALFLLVFAAGAARADLLPTTTTLAVGPNPGTLNQDIFLTATIAPVTPNAQVPTGTVTFTDGTGAAFVAPIFNGVATLILQPATGTYSYAATYSGDATYASSASSPAISERIEPGTSTTINVTPNPGSFGLPVTITSTVNPSTATGKITFYDHANVLGVAPISNGTASLTTSLLQSGLRSLTARYSGDANDLPSTSGVLTEGIIAQKGLGFGPPQVYTAGTAPSVLAIGDINGDGLADVVVANNGSNSISVFYGNGNGTFQAGLVYNTGSAPLAVVIGDFNADGFSDVALAGSDGIDVLYGSAGGALQPFVNVSGVPTAGLAVADFNMDGLPDLVGAGNAAVNVLISNGNGTFQNPVSCLAQSGLGVGVSDLNGDGIPDIAVSGSAGVSIATGAIDVSNNNAYSCVPGASYAVGANSQVLIVKDVNGDGNQDIVVAGFGAANVSVLLGVGNATFTVGGSFPSGSTLVTGLAIADFNGDGRPDILAADATQGGLELFVLLGNGNGTFGVPNGFPTDSGLGGVAAADFNGDGEADVAVVSPVTGHLDILLNGFPTVTITQGDTQSAPVFTTFPAALTVQAAGFGAIAPHVPVTFTAPATASTGFFAGIGSTVTVLTDGSGNATAPAYTANGVTGADGVTATAGSNTVTFSLNNTVQPCTFLISPSSLLFDANGGGATFTVTASAPNCNWNAATSSPSILLGNTSGVGNGSIHVLVPQNPTGVAISESIFVAGQSIPVQVQGTAQIFADVPTTAYYFDEANLMYLKGITAGCSTSPLDYCPTQTVTRGQMAVFLVRSIYGSDNFPFSQTPVFADVPANSTYFKWIQALSALNITAGCSTTPLNYCPNNPVTRGQMAIFIIRARYWAAANFDYPATPFFTDVPGDAFDFAWVQRMKVDNITSGCGTNVYCPNNNVLRQDMAVFIMRGAFDQFLPPTEPVILSVSPSTITSGAQTTVTVTGLNTHFVQNQTIVNVTPNLNVGLTTVTSPTTLTVVLTGTTPATAVPQSIWVTTGTPPNAEEAVLPNAVTIQQAQN